MAGASFPTTIERKDEQTVRNAAKMVDIRLVTYKERYKDLSTEKLLAIVAYDFALENIQMRNRNDTAPYAEKVKELTDLLETYFRKP